MVACMEVLTNKLFGTYQPWIIRNQKNPLEHFTTEHAYFRRSIQAAFVDYDIWKYTKAQLGSMKYPIHFFRGNIGKKI